MPEEHEQETPQDPRWPGGLADPQPGGSPARKYARGRVEPSNLAALKRKKKGVKPKLSGPIPATFDSRDHGWVPPVKNQGSCGSCWDFSGVGVVEIALIKAGILTTATADALSEQYVMDCGSNGGCSGDDNTSVLEMAEKKGLPKTGDYGPYKAREGQCRSKDAMALFKVDTWGFCDGGEGRGVTQTALIQQSIMADGSAGCAVAAGNGWDSYNGGEFSGGGNRSIDHDVVLVGWEPSKRGAGKVAWHMRNSWGEDWGDGGYMVITEGADLIGTEAVFAQAAGPGPAPPPPGPGPTPEPTSCISEFFADVAMGIGLWAAVVDFFWCLAGQHKLPKAQVRKVLAVVNSAHQNNPTAVGSCFFAFLMAIISGVALLDAIQDFVYCLQNGEGEKLKR